MDGSDRRVLVDDNISLPNGLVIDYETSTLCWGDAGTDRIGMKLFLAKYLLFLKYYLFLFYLLLSIYYFLSIISYYYLLLFYLLLSIYYFFSIIY